MIQGRMPTGQGSNSSLVGDFNARVILSALRRHGPASKADLSRMIGLTHNATGMISRKLEQDGLVRSLGKRQGGRGQPATMLELNPLGAYSIGVRVDRTLLDIVLVDLSGAIIDRHNLGELPEPEFAVSHLAQRIDAMVRKLEPAHRARITGIGVAMPYNLDSWLAELDLPEAKFRRWGGFDLRAALQQATGFAVTVENDGSAAAVGEMIYGRGREIGDFLYVFIGPAIGGGIVLAGDYLRGRSRNAADIGVVPVAASSLPSATGKPTILMARASLQSWHRHLRFHGVDATGEPALVAHAALFTEWARDAAEALAAPALTAAHLLDLSHIILGGDLPVAALQEIAGLLGGCMQTIVAESRTPPVVLAGAARDAAASVGAASLPLHDTYSPLRDGLTGLSGEAMFQVSA